MLPWHHWAELNHPHDCTSSTIFPWLHCLVFVRWLHLYLCVGQILFVLDSFKLMGGASISQPAFDFLCSHPSIWVALIILRLRFHLSLMSLQLFDTTMQVYLCWYHFLDVWIFSASWNFSSQPFRSFQPFNFLDILSENFSAVLTWAKKKEKAQRLRWRVVLSYLPHESTWEHSHWLCK